MISNKPWGVSSMIVPLWRSDQPCFTQVNWDAELYLLTAYIWFSHMASRRHMGTAIATPRSTTTTTTTCWLYCVKLYNGPDWWRGTPLSKPLVPSGLWPVASLGVGAAPQRSMILPVDGGTSERRDGETSRLPAQK